MDVLYSIEDLIAAFGGLFGLCTGASLLRSYLAILSEILFSFFIGLLETEHPDDHLLPFAHWTRAVEWTYHWETIFASSLRLMNILDFDRWFSAWQRLFTSSLSVGGFSGVGRRRSYVWAMVEDQQGGTWAYKSRNKTRRHTSREIETWRSGAENNKPTSKINKVNPTHGKGTAQTAITLQHVSMHFDTKVTHQKIV